MRMRWRGRTQSGFTLVELLLAVTLMSLLLGLAYGGLRAATQASHKGQEFLEDTGRLRITHQFIRRQLNQMLPLEFALTGGGDEELAVFGGSSQHIQFVAPMPGYLGNGGPQVQVIEAVNGERGLTLQFSHALLQGFLPDYLYEREPVILLEGVEYVQFEFLGRDEEGMISGWQSSWDQPSSLPVAVRLDLDLGPESNVTWPLLSTGVRVDELAVGHARPARDYSEAIQDLIDRRSRERRNR